jgi:hypothetical protein
MKMLVPLFALVTLVLGSSAQACVGETETELVQRYGKQTKTGTSHLPGVTVQGFQFKGFQIVAGVVNGRAAFEMYSKKDQSKLNANEIGALMKANGGTQAWGEEVDAAFEGKRWVLGDGSVIAELSKSGTDLTVMTRAGADLMRADKTPVKK